MVETLSAIRDLPAAAAAGGMCPGLWLAGSRSFDTFG
jgi:hypothetical protein